TSGSAGLSRPTRSRIWTTPATGETGPQRRPGPARRGSWGCQASRLVASLGAGGPRADRRGAPAPGGPGGRGRRRGGGTAGGGGRRGGGGGAVRGVGDVRDQRVAVDRGEDACR